MLSLMMIAAVGLACDPAAREGLLEAGWGVGWAETGVVVVTPARTDLTWELEWLVHTPLERGAVVEAVTAGPSESMHLVVTGTAHLPNRVPGAVVGLWLVGRDLLSGAVVVRSGAPRRKISVDGSAIVTEAAFAASDGWADGEERYVGDLADAGPAVHREEEGLNHD